jgi:hypothetical protein
LVACKAFALIVRGSSNPLVCKSQSLSRGVVRSSRESNLHIHGDELISFSDRTSALSSLKEQNNVLYQIAEYD